MSNNRKIQIVAIAVAIAASMALSTQDSFAAARQAKATARRSPAVELKAKLATALWAIRSSMTGVDEGYDAPSARVFTKK